MNEAKIREIVEKVISDNMPNKDEITQKAIEAVKEAEKKENDKPWLIKKGEEYWSGDSDDEGFWDTHTNNCAEDDKAWNLVGLVARTKDELREVIKARKIQREYEQWCMKYPVDWEDDTQKKWYVYVLDNGEWVFGSTFHKATDTVYCSRKQPISDFANKIGDADFVKYVINSSVPKYFLEV